MREITVTGSRTGLHQGRLRDLPDRTGVSFLPDRPFDPGETVDLSVRAGAGPPIRFRFTVARPAPLAVQAPPPGAPTRAGQVQEFHSHPDLRPPTSPSPQSRRQPHPATSSSAPTTSSAKRAR
ncbi:MAG: hypothetical protein ACTHMY_24965 [Solirubrobacteraceae bacterium]